MPAILGVGRLNGTNVIVNTLVQSAGNYILDCIVYDLAYTDAPAGESLNTIFYSNLGGVQIFNTIFFKQAAGVQVPIKSIVIPFPNGGLVLPRGNTLYIQNAPTAGFVNWFVGYAFYGSSVP